MMMFHIIGLKSYYEVPQKPVMHEAVSYLCGNMEAEERRMGRKRNSMRYSTTVKRKKPPYYSLLGLEIIEESKDFGKVKMRLSDELLNVYGFINGGIIVALADATVPNAPLTVVDKVNFERFTDNRLFLYSRKCQTLGVPRQSRGFTLNTII